MSHDETGDRRTPRHRPAVLLLAPAIAGTLALTGVPAQAAGPDARSVTADTGYSAGTYLVQLDDEPVAAYTGGTDGLKGTRPASGQRLDTGTRAVRAYQGHLEDRREDVLADVPGVKPLYTYDIVLNGFAARLTAAQANRLARTPGVTSLTQDRMLQPTGTTTETTATGTTATGTTTSGAPATGTTATGTAPTRARTAKAPRRASDGSLAVPDTAAFMGLKGKDGLYSKIDGGQGGAGEGMIIGVLDTGIDTSNPSLRALSEPRPDAEVIDKKWKGECDRGEDTEHQVTCNNKVIGARYFDKSVTEAKERDWASPRDADSHGTHTATTAAGNADVEATVEDTGMSGRISGLAPAARIAAYKVCWTDGCGYADVVAGFDQAVADGVDVINESIGGWNGALNGTLETAELNAAKAGVFISSSAGNDGPGTVANTQPWLTTVAASTHDTGYRATVTLGDGTSYTGTGTSASALSSGKLVDAARAARSGVSAADAELCESGTLDPDKVKGATVLCKRGVNGRVEKSEAVREAGGVGMVLYNASSTEDEMADAHSIPSVQISSTEGQAVKTYVDEAGADATASLSAARTVRQRAPMVAGFSSGGPDPVSGGDLLKPDLTAPGVDIVAGTAKGSPEFKGEQGVMSGTSMSAPEVAGLALLLKQLHPHWSVAEVKSALMTTASTTDDQGGSIQRVDGTEATPLDYGAGHVDPTAASDPGLVYDADSTDWTEYICAVEGSYQDEDGDDVCASAARTDPSDLNYPSISVGDLLGHQTVTRTVTNVSDSTGVYSAEVDAPSGYRATISPERLVVEPGESATYQVDFTRTDAPYGDYSFGSVTLTDADAGHTVRSSVALRARQFSAPAAATATTGATGSVTLDSKAGWNGTLSTEANGLYAGETDTGTLTGTNPDFDPEASVPDELPASTVKTEVTVPEGTTLARLALVSADYLQGSDVDMWVLDADTGKAVFVPLYSNDEHIDLDPGEYTVYLNQYELPEGTDSQTYTLHTWLIGDGTRPDVPASVDPSEQQVTAGDTAKTTLSWEGLSRERSSTWLGLVDYADGTKGLGRTTVTVTVTS